MAIQRRFLATLVGFWAILAPGAVAQSIADSVSAESTLEHAALPPEIGDPGRGDLSVEHPLVGAGSAREQVKPSADQSRETWVDPWAEAVAEALRLGGTARKSEPLPYPLVLNTQVQHFLDRFTRDRRDAVGLWVTRSAKYLGMIREVLKSRGLPEDLAFTAMIESGFNPVAVSRAGAVGLWQFMAATGRRYGLRVDQWVDERLDPEKSTFAAAAYLRDLYAQFGSWMLAQAAYNAGEVTVSRAIRATGSTDFWVLARTGLLRQETKEFVPQIQAATMIGRDPLQYGFESGDLLATSFESISVPPSTDLRGLSVAAGVPAEMLRALNPTLVRGVTPPGTAYSIRVPAGTGSGILAALAMPKPSVARSRSTIVTHRVSRRSETHVVRPKDTVSSIAKHYGVSVGDVLRWNSLGQHDRIRPGDRLKVSETRLSNDRQTGTR